MTRMLACLFLVAAAEAPVTRVELKDLQSPPHSDASRPSPGPFADVSAAVEAVPTQTLGQRGLQFTIAIRNRGARPVTMLDPAEYIQLELLNSKGYPVDLPPVPTGGLTPKQPDDGVSSSELAERRPFELSRPSAPSAGKATPAEPRVEQGLLTLPAGTEYRLTLRVHKILADPLAFAAAAAERARTPADARTPAAPPSPVVAIPPDRYSAKIQLSLVPPTGGDGSRLLESDPLAVDLKTPPSKAGR